MSRNDPALAARALARSDLAIAADALFPIRTGWGAKSELIAAVIDTWNVSADAVVFVDDSPLDIGEAVAVLPGVHGVRFPQDDAGLLPFFDELRALFGKRTATPEDRLRLTSSRQGDAYRTAVAQADAADRQDEFLSDVAATIDVAFGERQLKRALDLLNKTNQFNLNGRRYSEPALLRALRDHGRELVAIAYEDRFGPLGTIAALLIERQADTLVVESWAMSCRALARRIEDHTLHELFRRFDVAAITLEFAETERNAPMQEFLETVAGARDRWTHSRRTAMVRRTPTPARPSRSRVGRMNDLDERLARCFLGVFPALGDRFAAASAETTPEWDSLHALMLIAIIEETFEVAIPTVRLPTASFVRGSREAISNRSSVGRRGRSPFQAVRTLPSPIGTSRLRRVAKVVDVPLNTAIADLDEALRTLLLRELRSHGFDGVEIAFDAPAKEWSGKLTGPTVDLFLYDLRRSVGPRSGFRERTARQRPCGDHRSARSAWN